MTYCVYQALLIVRELKQYLFWHQIILELTVYLCIGITHLTRFAAFCSDESNGYYWEGDIEWENLSGNDKIFYFAAAKDSSSNINIGYSDTLHFQIINKTTILTTWDEEIVGQWDTGQNWGLFYVNSSVKYGMNDSPNMNYANNKSDYLTLMEPYDLSDYNAAYLQFWTGSFLRNNDVGTIQISDNGSIWESIYTISGINFVDTVKIDVTDYIDSGVLSKISYFNRCF